MKAFIIGALVVAVAVLGYFYYQRTQNDVTIQLPKVELKLGDTTVVVSLDEPPPPVDVRPRIRL